MYNVLVSGYGWPERAHTIGAGRILEHTDDPVLQRFTPNRVFDLDSAIELPTLFMGETNPQDPLQVARVGTITRARLAHGTYHLQYTFDPDVPPIPQSTLIAHAGEFQLNGGQFSRNHWAIKDGDLFQVLLRLANVNRPRPTVFTLPERPIEANLISAMMPFAGAFTPVYQAIEAAANDLGVRCRRADNIWVNNAIIQDVVDLIASSRVVVCDLSGKNANVFYEAGIAHTLGKEVVLLTQSHDDVPFDLRHLRYIHYLGNGEGIAQMGQVLKGRLTQLLA